MRVLFVCLGNICRSPTAEAVFRGAALKSGLPVDCDSAGTGAWHVGSAPDDRAIATAARHDLDMTALRARQITGQDFTRFDLIVAMDRSNLRTINTVRPINNDTLVRLLLDFATGSPATDVPDPYYESGFDGVFDLISDACAGLIVQLANPEQVFSAASPHSL